MTPSLLTDINSIGLQWFSTLTRKPAATAGGTAVGTATTAPAPVTSPTFSGALAPYTGVIVVGVLALLALFLIWIATR